MRLTVAVCKYLGRGPRPPRPLRPRQSIKVFNNRWYLGRQLSVADEGYKAACTVKNIQVYKPEDIFTPYLPLNEPLDFDFEKVQTEKKKFKCEEEHPFYHKRTAYCFNENTRFIVNRELDQAKVLTKTVEIESGLPKRLLEQIATIEREVRSPDEDDLFCDIIRETQMLDATQSLLPRNYVVPYIGWHPVLDKMSSKVPYDVTMSWQYRLPREYGIPIQRKNMNLMRGILRRCDATSPATDTLFRLHLEKSIHRQLVEKDDKLVRFCLPMPLMVTSQQPLRPHSNAGLTANVDLPDLSPLSPFASVWPKSIYNPQPAFPIKASMNACRKQFAHTCVDLYNAHIPLRTADGYHGRALASAFLVALGQARNMYGADVTGPLPEPVTVNMISTDGRKFHFSVFQLNTMDLSGSNGIKNIFWHEKELQELYSFCGYEKAVPVLRGYDGCVVSKIRAMYMSA